MTTETMASVFIGVNRQQFQPSIPDPSVAKTSRQDAKIAKKTEEIRYYLRRSRHDATRSDSDIAAKMRKTRKAHDRVLHFLFCAFCASLRPPFDFIGRSYPSAIR